MQLPVARNENIVVQNAGKELLIYDLVTNKAYCLNETSKIVYQACDGRTRFDDLKRKHKFTDDLIHFALDELRRENLITGDYASTFADVSRREAIKKVGLASMMALPIVSGLIAPTASMAGSGNCAPICIPVGGNFCANCTGPVIITAYQPNSGCTGPTTGTLPTNCVGPNNAGNFDAQRN